MMENLPDGWRWARLEEVVKFLDHFRKPVNESEREKRTKNKPLNELYPYYGANGQVGWIDDYIFDEELVLLAEDGGHFGSKIKPIAYKISGKYWVNNHAHVLQAIKGKVNIDYLHRILSFYDVRPFLSGSTRQKLNKRKAQKIPIPLPPLPEQKIIAEILQRADEIRQKRKRALGMVDEFLRSTFLEMFGDPATNPKEWDMVRLGEVCEIIMGQSPPSSTYNTQKLGLPFLQGKAEFTDLYAIPIKWCSSPKKVAEKDNILMSVRAPVGPVNLSPEKLCIGRGLCAIRGKIRKMNQRFLFHYLRFISKDLEKMGSGSTFKAITKKQVENIKIPLPPLSHQQAFARIAERAEETRSRLKQALNESEDLFNSLLDQAFTGELTAKWREEFYAGLRLSEPQGALFSILKGIPSHELPVTAVMKYGFLVQEEAGVGLGYAFEPYHYGPFTEEVYRDLDELESLGMVVQEEAGSERRIRLNYTGEVEVSEDVKEGAERILSEYGGLSLDELLERVYEKYPEYAERSRRGR